MDAIRLDVDGTITELTFTPGDTLTTLQEGVGGLVTCLDLSPEIDMWLDDEGVYTKEPNPYATAVARVYFGQRTQVFYGPAVFTGGVNDEGDTLPLSQGQRHTITRLVEEVAA